LITIVAICLLGWLERRRYLREHFFLDVVDQVTGQPIQEFRCRWAIITQETGIEPSWTSWTTQGGDKTITITVPQHCKLLLEAQSLESKNEGDIEKQSVLISSRSDSHHATLRLKASKGSTRVRDGDETHSSATCSLSGQVLDETGNPVPNFKMRLFSMYQIVIPTKGLSVQDAEGRFQIHGFDSVKTLFVETEGFALFQYGLLDDDAEPISEMENLTVRLSRGVTISGSIQRLEMQRGKTEVHLTDLRTCESIMDGVPVKSQNFPKENDELEVFRYAAIPDEAGRFEFTNIADGTYALLVLYNDQAVTMRPVVVGKNDVTIPAIKIPPTGSIQGTIREWQTWPRWQNDPILELHESSPFEIYQLGRGSLPSTKKFRVDHLGRFCIDDVLVGDGHFECYNQYYRTVMGFPFHVSVGEVTDSNLDLVTFLELEIESDPLGYPVPSEVKITGEKDSKAWIGKTKQAATSGISKWRLYGDSTLPSGHYRAEISIGYGKLLLEFDFERHRVGAERLYYRQLSLNDEQLNEVRWNVVQDGKPIAENYGSGMCFVPNNRQCDLFFQHHHLGWAHYQGVSFAKTEIPLSGIEWQKGGSVEILCSWEHLTVFPSRASLRNLKTGQSFEWALGYMLNASDKSIVFDNLMPGYWEFDLYGPAPSSRELKLHSKNFELFGTELIQYSMTSESLSEAK